MTEFQMFSEGKKLSTIRMERNQGIAIFKTDIWGDVNVIPYTWIDEENNECPIEVISLLIITIQIIRTQFNINSCLSI